ncbi:MAG: hypothetical protein U0325_28960 [Polyangiales bacterium]
MSDDAASAVTPDPELLRVDQALERGDHPSPPASRARSSPATTPRGARRARPRCSGSSPTR